MLAALLSQAYIFAQSPNALSIKENMPSTRVEDDGAFQQLRSCVVDSVIYTVTRSFSANGRYIYWHDLRTNRHDKMELEAPKKSGLSSSTLYSIQKSGEQFILVGSDDIFIFEKQSSSKCKLIKSIRNDKNNFHYIAPFGDRFFLYIDYQFHKLDAEHRHIWAFLNPKTYEIENLTLRPEENTLFSSLINSWVDVCGEKIAYASTTEYKVRIFNGNFKVEDSISTDELVGNASFMESLKSHNTDSKDGIMELRDHEEKILTRIRKVYFLNDSTIALLLHPPVTNESMRDSVQMHYWQKQNGTWQKIRTDYSTQWFREGGTYSAQKIPYNDFYQNANDIPYLGEYNFCEVYYPYISTTTVDQFNVDRDYFAKQNEAIRSKKPTLGVKIIHVDPFARQ